jgi:hypothetical protein
LIATSAIWYPARHEMRAGGCGLPGFGFHQKTGQDYQDTVYETRGVHPAAAPDRFKQNLEPGVENYLRQFAFSPLVAVYPPPPSGKCISISRRLSKFSTIGDHAVMIPD